MIVTLLTLSNAISLPEIIVLCLFIVFLAFALGKETPFLFAIAGLLGLLLGAQFGLSYINNQVELWYFGILGEALILFGLWLMIAGALKNIA